MRNFVLILSAFLVASEADAGSRGGHYTGPFDANLYPGATIKNFITDYSATCNGIADDQTAMNNFVTDAVAANPAKVVLYIPPGKTCHFSDIFHFMAGQGSTGINNVVVWGYGASVDRAILGGWTMFQDSTHEALIATANIGDSTVTVTDGNVARFSVGDWVCVNGVGLQHGGFPPNQQFFDYRVITAINGTVVTLSSPLTFAYESTWPSVDVSPNQGPAILYKMQPSWNVNAQIFGLTLAGVSSYQFQVQGKNIALLDVAVTASDGSGINMDFSAGLVQSAAFSSLRSIELDKMVSQLSISRSSSGLIAAQSASISNMTLTSVTASALNGWVYNTTILGGTYSTIQSGPTGYGHGNTVTLDGVTVANGPLANHHANVSSVSFSSGQFFIAKNAAAVDVANFIGLWVPGLKYYFGDTDGSHDASQNTTFTISDVSSDATNYYANLSNCAWGSCSGALPTPTCGANPTCVEYVAWPATTVVQRNKPAGSADLTGYASN